MPEILERARRQLQAKGFDKSSAYAIATKTLQKSGSMKKGSQKLTDKGKKRQGMGAAGRAIEREARGTKNPKSAYKYNPKTNQAKLKRGRKR